jgi:hypothetical protein
MGGPITPALLPADWREILYTESTEDAESTEKTEERCCGEHEDASGIRTGR